MKRIHWKPNFPVTIFVAILCLTALIAGLHSLNQTRQDEKLAEFTEKYCSFAFSQDYMNQSMETILSPFSEDDSKKSKVRDIGSMLGFSGTISVIYPFDQQWWIIEGWNNPVPFHASDQNKGALIRDLREGLETCLTRTQDAYFIGGRVLKTPNGSPYYLIVSKYIDY